MAPGFIYILINPSMPGLLKIGKSTRPSEDRAAELSAVTGIAAPFVVACEWNTSDCDTAELRVHERLEGWRYSKDREFFRLPLKEAVKIVSEICQQFISTRSESNRASSICTASVVCSHCRCPYTVTLIHGESVVICPYCDHSQEYQVEWL